MDLSKAFDAMPHDLLLAKLRAYWMSESALKALRAYFLNSKQGVKISDTYSDWDTIIKGIPQGSILGPILLTVLSMICFILSKMLIYTFMLMTILYGTSIKM